LLLLDFLSHMLDIFEILAELQICILAIGYQLFLVFTTAFVLFLINLAEHGIVVFLSLILNLLHLRH
jgi:hypothetical protein